MPKPYTIRLFIPEGDPSTFKIIDKMNWTGIGLEISRVAWEQHKNRKELDQAGIYILFGYQESDDLPTLYIGQGDGIKKRIDSHEKNKEFWDKVLVFVSSSGGLNRAHITWHLGYVLVFPPVPKKNYSHKTFRPLSLRCMY